MAKCVSCQSKVEEGAVRCFSCGATLSTRATFLQVIGWVLFAISSIPVGLGIVLEGEHDHILLILGCVMLVLGLAFAFGGKAKAKSLPATVIEDEPVSSPAQSS